MSPRRLAPASARVRDGCRRVGVEFGVRVRDTRLARGWSVQELADLAGLSPDMVYRVESGSPASPQTAVRLALALGRRLEVDLVDPRREVVRASLSADIVHSAMGELEARHLRQLGASVGIDEPYQHFQFAGRADVVAWNVERRALLHLENRTRFPDFQEMAGAFNAKRAYLGAAIGERTGVRRWASETHVIVGLWSAEVLHALRLREASFRALCPDDAAAFSAWWSGDLREVGEVGGLRGTTSTLVVLDPGASPRERPFVDLDAAMRARPRYRGYVDAVTALAPAA